MLNSEVCIKCWESDSDIIFFEGYKLTTSFSHEKGTIGGKDIIFNVDNIEKVEFGFCNKCDKKEKIKTSIYSLLLLGVAIAFIYLTSSSNDSVNQLIFVGGFISFSFFAIYSIYLTFFAPISERAYIVSKNKHKIISPKEYAKLASGKKINF